MDAFAVDLFRHNLWANLRLLDACRAIPDEQLDAVAPGTYGSVRDTLLHMLAAEGRYVGELSRERPDEPLVEGQPFPGLDVLGERAQSSGDALIRLATETSDNARVSGTYRGQPYETSASILFIQAINHATEHRAHVVSTLTPLGFDAPGLDALNYLQTGASSPPAN